MKLLTRWIKNNKVVTVLVSLLILEGILYFLFAHRIIESAYNGESIGVFNKLLAGREQNSLEFYLHKFDTFFIIFNILFFLLALGTSFFIRLLFIDKISISANTRRILNELKCAINANKKAILLSLFLAAVFYLLYGTLGNLLIPNYTPNKYTFFFADQGDWVDLQWDKFHKGSHPLLLLFLAPFGILRLLSPPLPTIVIAVLINSFFGAGAVFTASLFFWSLTKRYLDTLLLTIFFGLSMSQLFFSTLIESYALAGWSIITSYLLFIICLKTRQLHLFYWLLAGIFSFGVTITNFAQTFICFAATLIALKENNKITTFLEYCGAIFTVAFFLNLIQKKLLGGAYFFVPEMLSRETEWIKVTIFTHPILITKELFRHFLLVNFISPSPFPEVIIPGEKIVLSFFDRRLNYSILGMLGITFWLGFFLMGVYRNIIDLFKSSELVRRFLFPVAGCIVLITLAFYSIFDTVEMFLFTCNFSFSVLLLGINPTLLKKKYFQIILILLIFITGINNLIIMKQIIMT
jgi:hypothetical protein